MIDKIQLLHRALGSLRVAQEPQSPAAAPAQGESRARAAPPTGSAGQALADVVRRRVAAIPADDPQRRRRMLRTVLETCLASEWGNAVAGDPAFHALVDQVQQTIESDASLQSLVDDALASVTSQN